MNTGIDTREALELLAVEGPDLYDLLARAGRLKLEQRGPEVVPCAIVNAKCGNCGQDCAFCAQSSRSSARIERFPLRPPEELLARARDAADMGACRVGLVTSGRSVSRARELRDLARAVEVMARELPVEPCASLGLLDAPALEMLREAGLNRYHHNLETAESFFPRICSTRTWRSSVETIEAAKALGMSVCCGGIFGLGESPAHRVELLATLRDLAVDSVPINFLHPIAGTPLESAPPLAPLECLKVVAVARLMMPRAELRVCGGREHNLRDLGSWLFLAGADGLMVGGYLTTKGRSLEDDVQMVRDAGLRFAPQTPPAR